MFIDIAFKFMTFVGISVAFVGIIYGIVDTIRENRYMNKNGKGVK